MCKLCDEGKPQDHDASLRNSRRDFLMVSAVTAVAAAGSNFLNRPAAAAPPPGVGPPDEPPGNSGNAGRRYIIRGGYVMSMDPSLPNSGNFAPGDVLVEGN